MLLTKIVDGLLVNPSAGFLLDRTQLARCLKKAVRFYCGYQKLVATPAGVDGLHDPVSADDLIDGNQDFDLSPSEYAIIRPLFDLYVELENAILLEASRGMGVDVFGRTTDVIQQDINQHELDLPKLAFIEPAETI